MEAADEGRRSRRFVWTEQQTHCFIELRIQHDALFTGVRNASLQGFDVIIREMGLERALTPSQAAKKWENLKKKYRDLILLRISAETEGGQITAATWPYFEPMHQAMGEWDSVRPISLLSTAVDTESDEDPDGGPSIAPRPSTPTAPGSSGGSSTPTFPGPSMAPEPSTIQTPPSQDPRTSAAGRGGKGKGKGKRSGDELLDFVMEDAMRRQARQREMDAREQARETRNQLQMDRFLGILERFVDSQTDKGKGKVKRSSDEVLDFLMEDAKRREARQREMDAREQARETRHQQQMDRFLGIFERFVDSQTDKK